MEVVIVSLAVAGLVAAAFLIYVALLPDEFRIERTTEILAPQEAIFPLINDLRKFNTWNPFAKADPTVKITYSGPAKGNGSAYEWSGRKAGAGRMEIATSAPTSKVIMDLRFTKPFVANNIAEFKLQPSNDGATNVTWAMTGRRRFSHKLMGTLFGMDTMVGGEFAKGLADLKALSEGLGVRAHAS